jgi:hypothetical protein
MLHAAPLVPSLNAHPPLTIDQATLHHGDGLELLPTLPDTFDA